MDTACLGKAGMLRRMSTRGEDHGCRARDGIGAGNKSAIRAEIPVIPGSEISGKPLVCDLAGMPHLLVAGAPGGDQRECIRSIITSMVSRKNNVRKNYTML